MHISNLVGQYQKNATTNSTDELKGASSMQKMVSAVSKLSAGSVFEGTVTSAHGGKVILSLSTGQQLVAQLDSKVKLTVGQPMFFQVKSNQGGTLAIRPYNDNGNPILLNALTSAGVPVTERNLEMVNAMMHRQMPINKQSILEMAKVVSGQETVSVQTAVDMTRLGLPVDEELAAQFERYRAHDHELLGKMENAVDQTLALFGEETMSPEQAVSMNHKLLEVALKPELAVKTVTDDISRLLGASGEAADGQTGLQALLQTGTEMETQNLPQNGVDKEMQYLLQNGADTEAVTLELHTAGKEQTEGVSFAKLPLETVLTEKQLGHLTKLLQSTPALVEKQGLFLTEPGQEVFVDTLTEEAESVAEQEVVSEQVPEKQTLNSKLPVEDFLKLIQDGLAGKQESFLGIQKLLTSKEYKSLLKNILQEQWLLQPEDLKKENKVSETYERLVKQLEQLEQIVKSAGMDEAKVMQTTADIRSNVKFMNQVNQIYTYVQLPLKLAGQKTNGDLYVYTNKKNLQDPDSELSAFLHLEMDHLGATDVSVKLQYKHVKTNFYFSDDESYELIQKHLPLLEAKLNKLGYNCTFTVSNEEKKVNFVNDFLRKDLPAAGKLHRYSFDVRT